MEHKYLSVAILLMGFVVCGAPARASQVYDLTTCFQSAGCPTSPPYGTVTVSSLSGNEIAITVALATGDVFSFGGAGRPLAFDLSLSGSPTVTATVPSGWSFTQAPMTMLDGSGTWNDYFNCSTCGSGTSGKVSGPVTFDLSVASGTITPQSFALNNKNLYFVSDIGIPQGSGYSTGDVAAPSVVPLPATVWLLLSALGGFGLLAGRRATL